MSSDAPRAKRYLKIQALSAVRDRRIDDGIAKYKEYLDLDENKDDDDAWAGLGGAYRRSGDIEKAVNSYKIAYELNPSSTYALVNLVSLMAAKNDAADRHQLAQLAARAETLSDQAIDNDPANRWARYDRATLQLIQGKTAEAKASFTYAASATPNEAKENFRSVLSNLEFLRKHKPDIPGIGEVIQLVESFLPAPEPT